MTRNKSVKILTLGCDKNLVDSEILIGALKEKNVRIVENEEYADFVIVNTCGFLERARKESIISILEAAELKNQNRYGKLLVMGCMSAKYGQDIKSEIKEVDYAYGVTQTNEIVKIITGNPYTNNLYLSKADLETKHLAYIRISDGCNHACSYCSIPSMRGKLKSRKEDDILAEIENDLNKGKKELVIIGQEINSYGLDLYNEFRINPLLKEISSLVKDRAWIRLLYTYPSLVNQKFIETMAEYENICNYIDFPIQHTEDSILKVMNRGETQKTIFKKLEMMRDIIPEIAIRTSLICGFPMETRKIFNQMLKTVEKMSFDRLGCFAYSREEGTKAIELDYIPTLKTAEKRVAELMKIQQQISYNKNQELIGKVEKVLVDRYEGEYSVCRSFRDAVEIDNEILVKEKLPLGEFSKVLIEDAFEFDLVGKVVE